MQQQIQVRQAPEQCLSEASAFFARRRAKVSERTEQGFRFGLEGGEADQGGRVSVAPGAGGATTVTVEAEGLGVLAIAEGFIRELRKQARGANRQTRPGAVSGASSGFADLRQRLGLPEAEPERPARPAPAPRAEGSAANVAGGTPGPESVVPAPRPAGTPANTPPPRDADPANAAVAAAAAAEQVHDQGAVPATPGESRTATEGAARLPSRDLATSAADASATTAQPPGHQSLAGQAPSAEQLGGVPAPEDVQVAGRVGDAGQVPAGSGESGGAVGAEGAGAAEGAAPLAAGRQTPGPDSGEPAGAAAPPAR